MDVLTFVMAGGKGERLLPLTADRAKPAVPFGGIYRLIDFPLSNCVNSGLYNIVVLPQYKSQSLNEHLEIGWNIFSRDIGHFLKTVPPQQRISNEWYRGTADCIRQNRFLIDRYGPQYVLILSGDHVYKMDYAAFLQYHRDKEAHLTVSLLEMDRSLASQVGVAEVDDDFRIRNFREKPKHDVRTVPGDETRVLGSMGIYLFDTGTLVEALESSPKDDFGGDIVPEMLGPKRVYAYPFRRMNAIEDEVWTIRGDGRRERRTEACVRDSSYWRDVGTLDAYWNANMDLTGVDPSFNLYGVKWPIYTHQRNAPPAKFIFSQEEAGRVGKAQDSLVAPGCIVSGLVRDSVLSFNVTVRSWTRVEESMIADDVVVGRHCRIKKAIVDKENVIPDRTEIGYDPRADRERFTVTPRGITVVPRGTFPPA
jgi:glucose-1-phosphate adenylyltransferase